MCLCRLDLQKIEKLFRMWTWVKTFPPPWPNFGLFVTTTGGQTTPNSAQNRFIYVLWGSKKNRKKKVQNVSFRCFEKHAKLGHILVKIDFHWESWAKIQKSHIFLILDPKSKIVENLIGNRPKSTQICVSRTQMSKKCPSNFWPNTPKPKPKTPNNFPWLASQSPKVPF